MFREGYILEVQHDELFVDEVTISLLQEIRGKKRKYLLSYYEYEEEMAKSTKAISEEQAIKWILEQYTNKKSDRKKIKEEKIYILHLMGVGDTKIGEYFGVSRQTIHKKIKDFEENRLQEFRRF